MTPSADFWTSTLGVLARNYSTLRAMPATRSRRASKSGSNSPINSWPTATSPTPYDILPQQHAQGASSTTCSPAYDKTAFLRLVKTYHPDNYHHQFGFDRTISKNEAIERYRLVVAAHELLSDPVRRAAYNRSGEGWQAGTILARPHSASTPEAGSRTWSYQRPENPTYDQQQTQQHIFASNRAFTMLVLLFTLLVGAMELAGAAKVAQRASRVSREADLITRAFLANEELLRRPLGREARIRLFCFRRDACNLDLSRSLSLQNSHEDLLCMVR